MIPDDSDKEVFRRTKAERPEPIERVVDAVASRIAFWSPSVEPVVRLAVSKHVHVLEAFEAARREWAPEASQESAYIAFSRFVGRPIVLVRAQMAARRADKAAGRTAEMESYALRAVRCIHSPEARRGVLFIPRNHRIPASSSIAAYSGEPTARPHTSLERLGTWTSSDGGRLDDVRVLVTVFNGWASIELA